MIAMLIVQPAKAVIINKPCSKVLMPPLKPSMYGLRIVPPLYEVAGHTASEYVLPFLVGTLNKVLHRGDASLLLNQFRRKPRRTSALPVSFLPPTDEDPEAVVSNYAELLRGSLL
jgi:hypothetical protein